MDKKQFHQVANRIVDMPDFKITGFSESDWLVPMVEDFIVKHIYFNDGTDFYAMSITMPKKDLVRFNVKNKK